MGLDNWAMRGPDEGLPEEDKAAFDEADIHLCEFSGGDSSFRGKIYEIFVSDITDVSLHEEWIPPENIRVMLEAMERCDMEAFIAADDYHRGRITVEEAESLKRFFRVCVERGLGIIGSW